MAIKKIGRYRVFGSNNHYIIGRWDGQEYRVMNSVPSYTTMGGAMRKATTFHKKDIKDGIRVKI